MCVRFALCFWLDSGGHSGCGAACSGSRVDCTIGSRGIFCVKSVRAIGKQFVTSGLRS